MNESVLTQDCLIAFGSNLGDSKKCFSQACDVLANHSKIASVCSSELIQTLPAGGTEGQRVYWNGCLRILTSLDPRGLFLLLCQIEKDLGRIRRERWGARHIDLDLLLVGDLELESETPKLIIPHPRMSFRRFVLLPASQIAAEMAHPCSGLSISELLQRLDELPDQVGLIVDRDWGVARSDTLASIQQVCHLHGFKLQVFSESDIERDAKELAEYDSQKLLIYCGESESNLAKRVSCYRGATLILSDESNHEIQLELKGALQAMKPL